MKWIVRELDQEGRAVFMAACCVAGVLTAVAMFGCGSTEPEPDAFPPLQTHARYPSETPTPEPVTTAPGAPAGFVQDNKFIPAPSVDDIPRGPERGTDLPGATSLDVMEVDCADPRFVCVHPRPGGNCWERLDGCDAALTAEMQRTKELYESVKQTDYAIALAQLQQIESVVSFAANYTADDTVPRWELQLVLNDGRRTSVGATTLSEAMERMHDAVQW